MNSLARLNEILKLACVLVLALSAVACGKSNNEERIARSSSGLTPYGQTNSPASACSAPAGAIGRVFEAGASSSGGSFESRVKGLISANYNPEYIGSIAGVNGPSATCVTLEGSLQFDSSGQLLASKANLLLKVYDSLAEALDTTGNPAGAYKIGFAGAQSGELRGDGTFTVIFSDNLGTLTVTGRTANSQVQGSIQYTNAQNFSGGTPASGLLGAFAINTSSFLK